VTTFDFRVRRINMQWVKRIMILSPQSRLPPG
jgi:hypothetical protein